LTQNKLSKRFFLYYRMICLYSIKIVMRLSEIGITALFYKKIKCQNKWN